MPMAAVQSGSRISMAAFEPRTRFCQMLKSPRDHSRNGGCRMKLNRCAPPTRDMMTGIATAITAKPLTITSR